MLTSMYISTVCMTTAIIMAGSCLGEDRKPQMKIDLDDTTDIVPPLTKSLNLTCSLVPAADSDYDDEKGDYVSILGVYMDVKKPSWRVREAINVAKVSHTPDEAEVNPWQLHRVTIIGFNRSEGFIKVGVSEPDSTHAGDYTCRVLGRNAADDSIRLTHTASVQYKAPESGNIAKYVHKLELKLEEQAALLEEKDALLEEKDASQDTEISKRVSKADIQQGYTHCEPGTGWSIDTVQITFPHRYSKAPRVFVSVGRIVGNGYFQPDGSYTDDDTGTEYEIEAHSVTQTGFTLDCVVYRYSYINSMFVQWIAFPRP